MPEFLWRAAHADGQAAEGRTEAAAYGLIDHVTTARADIGAS